MDNRELAKIMSENPELPVVALVNGEICWDDSSYWMAGFSAVSIENVGLIGDRWYDDFDSFTEAYYDKYSTELCKMFEYNPRCCTASVQRGEFTDEQFEINCLAEAQLEEYLREKANEYMKRCIVVYVDVPDLTTWQEA